MKTCPVPNCGQQNPSQGHFFAHQRRGELVRIKKLVGTRWELVWALPEEEIHGR